MPDKTPKRRGDDPALSEPKLRGDCRRLDLDDGTWQWKTNGSVVTVYSPTGVATTETFVPQDEAGVWEITPSDVKAFIETSLRA